jgi:hypothetical protein
MAERDAPSAVRSAKLCLPTVLTKLLACPFPVKAILRDLLSEVPAEEEPCASAERDTPTIKKELELRDEPLPVNALPSV